MVQPANICQDWDDNSLLHACRMGNEQASFCLVKRYYGLFKVRLLAQGAQLPDIEDAFQDAMVALHLHLLKNPTFEVKGTLEAYFWTITHNAYLKHIKKYDRARVYRE